MRALIIEDQFLIATLIEDVLRDMGYSEFDVVDNREGALQAARRNCPELITADERIVAGSGVNAVREICAEHGDIPTVFITSYGGDVREALPDAIVVSKPFGALILEEAVNRAVLMNPNAVGAH